MDGAAGAETVRAAAQDHRVAGFQAQHAGIGRDVGAAFEDHRDDAERHPHPLDGHAVRPLPAFGDDADRIGDLAHDGDAIGHRLDARRGQRQPVDEGGAGAAGARLRDILGIGGEDRGASARIARSMASSAWFFCSGEASASTRAAARARVGEVGHQGRQIGVPVDRFQRRGHLGSIFG